VNFISLKNLDSVFNESEKSDEKESTFNRNFILNDIWVYRLAISQ
jgi:hypothetical protein